MSERNAGLDGIRFVAEAMVFTCHAAYYGAIVGSVTLPLTGLRNGVVLFFVLSGYLLYAPFAAGRVELRGYAIRRFARIVPAYIVALVGTTLLSGDDTFLRHPLTYLLFLQNFTDDPRIWQGFLGVSWTLVCEVMFYASLPILARALNRSLGRLLLLGAVSLAASMVVCVAAVHSPYGLDPRWPTSQFPFVLWAFVPGMALALRQPRFLGRGTTPLLGVALIEASVMLGVMPGFWWVGFDFVAGAGAYLLVGWAVVARPQRFARFAGAGAAISYSAYLWHVPIIAATRAFLPAVLSTIAVASLVYVLVERPILRRAHALARRLVAQGRPEQAETGLERGARPGVLRAGGSEIRVHDRVVGLDAPPLLEQ